MDGKRNSLTRKEYISRINDVQDYIETNINNNLTLEELSSVSGFSKFHFHRIFKSIVNETLYNYINRIRLEKAVSFLLHNEDMSITEAAYKFGFSDSAVFARSFKKYFGMSASEYRFNYSNNCKEESKERKDPSLLPRYNESVSNIIWKGDNMPVKGKIDVQVIDDMHVIYLRHTGSYKDLGLVFEKFIHKLINWAAARDLMKNTELKLLAIYHDNPEITEDEKQRTSVCMVVPEDVEGDGEVGKMVIPSGKYAIGHFEIDASEYGDAWNYLYGQWLSNSGFEPTDGFAFEMYRNDPNTHPEKKHIVDIYLPVKPL